MASRMSAIFALCVLTSASIHPLIASPQHIVIADLEDGAQSGRIDDLRRSDAKGESTSADAKIEETDSTASTDRLAPIDLNDMKLWNWEGRWHASHWDNPWSSTPFSFDHVQQDEAGNTHLIFDAEGAPELRAQRGHPFSTKAYYEVDVTVPELRSGLVVAPLWLWNNDTKDEVDFEFVGDQYLQTTVHSYRSGSHKTQVHKFYGDFSGRRMRFAIETDLAEGRIDMLVNGEIIHTYYNNTNAFPTGKMRPVMSMWVGDQVDWAEPWTGPWGGLKDDEQIVMTVHGYYFEQREDD